MADDVFETLRKVRKYKFVLPITKEGAQEVRDWVAERAASLRERRKWLVRECRKLDMSVDWSAFSTERQREARDKAMEFGMYLSDRSRDVAGPRDYSVEHVLGFHEYVVYMTEEHKFLDKLQREVA